MMELFSKKLGWIMPGKNIRKQWSTISWPAEWKIPAPPRTPAFAAQREINTGISGR